MDKVSFGNLKYRVRAWSGIYGCERHGMTDSIIQAAWWSLSWSVMEFFRVLYLNNHHFGNILGMGDKLTDPLGRRN